MKPVISAMTRKMLNNSRAAVSGPRNSASTARGKSPVSASAVQKVAAMAGATTLARRTIVRMITSTPTR